MAYYLPRVTHLDCLRIDNDIENHFTSSVLSILRKFYLSIDSWKPEIKAILRFAIAGGCTVWSGGRSMGQRLLSCQYAATRGDHGNFRRRLLCYLTSDILVTWLHDRLDDARVIGLSGDASRALKAIFYIMQTLNAFIFLLRGKFASLSERIFGVTMKSSARTTLNTIPHAVLERELLWQGMTEFLLFLWPLIRNSRWIARLKNSRRVKTDEMEVDSDTCLLCRQTPKIQPHQFCAHSFCYYCVTTAYVQSQFFACPVCAAEMTTMADLHPACPSF